MTRTLATALALLENPTDELVETVARHLANADGVEIYSDASYRVSTYGKPAKAAIQGMLEHLKGS